MKKQTIILLFATMLAFPLTANADEVTYDGDVFSFSYDDDIFTVTEGDDYSVIITAIDIPNDDYNTYLSVETSDSSYETYKESEDESVRKAYLDSYLRTMCIAKFVFGSGLDIEDEGSVKDSAMYEYHMTLSDGSECFAKAFECENTLSYALFHLCSYTDDLNDSYKEIYDSIKSAKDNKTEPIVETDEISEPDTNSETEVSTESATSAFTFRGYAWGTSLDEIKQKEITSDMVEDVDYGVSDGSLIIVDGQVSSYDANICFELDEENKLKGGQYIITEKHSDYTGYYNDFENLADLYSKKYGEPQKYDLWKNDLYKDDKSDWGLAAACGHATFWRIWTADDGSEIIIGLTGDNFKTNTFVLYNMPGYDNEDDMTGI